jgi:hypothetical protein
MTTTSMLVHILWLYKQLSMIWLRYIDISMYIISFEHGNIMYTELSTLPTFRVRVTCRDTEAAADSKSWRSLQVADHVRQTIILLNTYSSM